MTTRKSSYGSGSGQQQSGSRRSGSRQLSRSGQGNQGERYMDSDEGVSTT